MPNGSGHKGKGHKPNGRKSRDGLGGPGSSAANASRFLINQAMVGASAEDHFISSDLALKPVSSVYRSSVPRNLLSQVYYMCCKNFIYITTSTTGNVETNYSWTASGSMPQYTNWLVLFDQYMLDSVTLTIANNSNNALGTANIPQVLTVVDFDNSNTLGSAVAYSSYGCCNAATLAPGQSVTRFVRPCNSSYLGSTAGAGVTRTWVDSNVTSIPFYAFKTFIPQVGTVGQLDYVFQFIWAFRNSV